MNRYIMSFKKAGSKGKISWPLFLMTGSSLVLHLIILWSCSSIVMFKTLTVPDLIFQDVSKPSIRSIPRPRSTPRSFLDPAAVKDLKDLSINTPSLIKPIRPAQLSHFQKGFISGIAAQSLAVEGIAVASISGLAGNNGLGNSTAPILTAWNPQGILAKDTSEFLNPGSYFEMIRLKIERCKKYPETAQFNHIEGRVTVRFMIMASGDVKEVNIIRSSKNTSLDKAAISAIQNAAPFPVPPENLFKKNVLFEIAINFELR